ncbi:MAG: His/Gly/Thr/Pro-type tRNA ligase C-terminal domain-containing protein [Candidatus Woesebacteria bacterium]|jgi:prolyl-tRNA synthetase
MKMSQLAFRPLKNPPANADTLNHALLVQAGFVRQLMAGVYSYTPLGLKVLNKIRNVIREEMNAIGGQEILMPSLHPSKNWKQTGAWDGVDVLFKIKSRTDRDYALGQSHEEVVTPLAKDIIKSYRDLPLALYQIHWKFRDELRAKSGILRGREFEMKDMYSFHETQSDFDKFYQKVKDAYLKAYKKIDLVAKVTEASGGSFSNKISYEFMVLTDAGEDDIYYCSNCEFCVNSEIAKKKAGDICPNCKKAKLKAARASEVGNVFDLGQKYSKDFDLSYTNQKGEKKQPIMGCYGWGTTRTMGVVVEKSNDKRGIIWPKAIAPFQLHLISIKGAEQEAKKLYQQLLAEKIEIIWDDRDENPGSKFADADLIGIPVRLVVSLKNKNKVEWKERDKEKTKLIKSKELIKRLKASS